MRARTALALVLSAATLAACSSSTTSPTASSGAPAQRSNPMAGSPVPKINDKTITVPRVVGMRYIDAFAKLEDAGFAVSGTHAEKNGKPELRVLQVIPVARSVMPVGSSVQLIVSAGPHPDPTTAGLYCLTYPQEPDEPYCFAPQLSDYLSGGNLST